MLRRMVGRLLVEARVAIVRVSLDDAVLNPPGEGGLVDSETTGDLLLGKQPAGAQSVEPRPEAIRVHDVLHARRRESGATFPGPCGPTGTEPARVEGASDLVVDVMVEELVDELDDVRRRLHLFPGCLRVHGRECRRLTAPKADMDLRGPVVRLLHERSVLDQIG